MGNIEVTEAQRKNAQNANTVVSCTRIRIKI